MAHPLTTAKEEEEIESTKLELSGSWLSEKKQRLSQISVQIPLRELQNFLVGERREETLLHRSPCACPMAWKEFRAKMGHRISCSWN